MFFLDPQQKSDPLNPSQMAFGDPTTIGEVHDAAVRNTVAAWNSNSRDTMLIDAYDNRIDAIFKATGQRLVNPARAMPTPDDMKEMRRLGMSGGRLTMLEFGKYARDRFQNDLLRIAESNPDKANVIQPYVPIQVTAAELAQKSEADLADIGRRASRFARNVGGLTGGFSGSLRDPLNIALMPIGLETSAAKSLLWNAVRAGVTNMGAQAVVEPFIQSWRAEAGLSHGWGEAALDVGMSGLVGAGLDLVPRGLVRGGKKLFGKQAPPIAGEAPPAAGSVDPASAPADPSQALHDAAMARPEGDPIRKAAEGDPQALMDLYDKALAGGLLSPHEEDALRGAKQSLEAQIGAHIDTGDDLAAAAQAIRHAQDPSAEPPPGVHEELPPAHGPDLGDEAAPPVAAGQKFAVEGKPVVFRHFDPATVVSDPQSFQFKHGGDAAGVTDRLRGVGKWDPLASGKIIAFERADGQLVIADGHQRLGLAKRIAADGQKAELMGYLFREKDGWTPADVRAIAAKKNLQEGSGSILDGAKIIRERPDILDKSVPITEGKLRQSRQLAKLSDEAFGMAVAGVVPENFAAIVGEHVQDPSMHAGIIGELARAGLDSTEQARLLVAQMLTMPSSDEVQLTLLGELRTSRPLLVERTQVLDAALKMLKRDSRVFNMLENDRARIEAAGNVLGDGNAARAEAAGSVASLIETLASQRGRVSDMLSVAAKDVWQGVPIRRAADQFAQTVRAILDTEGVKGLVSDAPLAEAAHVVTGGPDNPLLFALRGSGLPDESRLRLLKLTQDAIDAIDREPAPSSLKERISDRLAGKGAKAAEGQPGTAGASAGGEPAAHGARAPAVDRNLRAEALQSLIPERYSIEAINARRMEHGFTVEAWHGTEAGFDTPDPHRNRGNGDYGFHFALGSAAAANERIGYAATWVGKLTVFLTQDHRPRNPAYRILPLVVNAHHPFEMPDLGNWAAPSIWRKWAGSSEFKGPNELRDYILAPIPEGQAPLAWHRGLEAVLEKLGYDSIQYKNIVEAAGSQSMFVWRPELVRSTHDLFHADARGEPGFFASDIHAEREMRGKLNEFLAEEGLPENTLFAFGGTRAKAAPLDRLEQAKQLDKSGVPADDIWGQTGWMKKSDGLWRFEIDDSEMTFVPAALTRHSSGMADGKPTWGFDGKLSELIHHPGLFQAYPELANLKVSVDPRRGWLSAGSFDPEKRRIKINGTDNLDDLSNTLVHEVQHAIQEIEGFSKGGNESTLAARSQAAMFELKQQIAKLRPGSNIRAELEALGAKLDAQINEQAGGHSGFSATDANIEAYRRLIGEVEARNVATRRHLSPAYRAIHSPHMTEDVPAAEQFAGSGLVRFEHEHAAIAKSAVKDHYPGLPDMVEGVSTYGRVKDVRYKGIPLSPDFRGDNSPGRMPGRGNVSRSMEFSQEGITSSINAFGIDALIKHIDQHIDYSVTGPMYLDKETGQLAPPEGAAGPYRHVPNEPHLRALRSVRDMLAEIRSEHPELGPEQGYRVHNLDTEGLMERYSGPKFTKDDATKARGELEAAIRQLKGTSTKHLSDYEAPSTTSMMITEKMIEHAISDLHNQGFDGPYGIAGSTVGKTLIALHPDVASKYRLITDYLQFEDRAGATGMMRSISEPHPAAPRHEDVARVAGFETRPVLEPKKMAAVRAEVDLILKTLPPEVKVRVEDRILIPHDGKTYELAGYFNSRDLVIAVALDSENPAKFARHEKVHALRQLGLIADSDWTALTGLAEKLGLRKEWKIDERYKDLYTTTYKDPARVESYLNEEVIAEMVARYNSGERFDAGGPVDRLLQIIHEFLNKIREALGAHQVRKLEDIFSDLEGPARGSEAAKAGVQPGDAAPLLFALRPAAWTKQAMDEAEDLVVAHDQAARELSQTPGGDIAYRGWTLQLESSKLSAADKAYFNARWKQYHEDLMNKRSASEAAAGATERTLEDMKSEALERKRVGMIQLRKIAELKGLLFTHKNARGDTDVAELLTGLLEHYGLEGGDVKSSVDGKRKAILGGAHSELESMLHEFRKTAGLGTRMNAARLENVVHELFGTGSGDTAARDLAKAWSQVSDRLRERYNTAGGNVPQLKDWGLPQSHNSKAVRNAGFAKWKQNIETRLDWNRMTHPLTGKPIASAERREVLDHVFKTITTDGLYHSDPAEIGGKGALYKKHAEHRFLVFKNSEAWLTYQKAFGAGGEAGIFATMMHHINVMARDIAAMEVLGPNPEATRQWLKNTVKQEAARVEGGFGGHMPKRSPKGLPGYKASDYAASQIYRHDQMWAIMRGEATTPVNGYLANIFAGARNLTMASSLSAASLSSLTDFGRQAIHRRFAGATKAARGGSTANPFTVVNDVVQQFSGMKRREAVKAGLMLESALNVMHTEARYVGALNGPMMTQYIADRMLTWNGLIPLTQAQRHSFGLSIMTSVADHLHRDFAQVPKSMRETFNRYGMGAAEWDALKAFAPPKGGPDELRMLTAPMITDRKLGERYLEMILQETERAVPQGTVAGRALLVGDTRPGTLQGELLRTTAMLKSYGATVLMQDMGRIASEMAAGRKGSAAWFGASILITSTLIGALILQLKATVKGEDPRPMDDEAFWGAAMMQGGGLGIYGDFMFGQVNRFGGGFSQTIGGPLTDRVSNLWNLTGGNALQYAQDPQNPTNFGKETTNFARLNLNPPFYLKLAWERMVLDELQKMADPDARKAFRRKIQARKKHFGQDYWWAPGQQAPTRAPNFGAALGGGSN